jgi:hypothetical protein
MGRFYFVPVLYYTHLTPRSGVTAADSCLFTSLPLLFDLFSAFPLPLLLNCFYNTLPFTVYTTADRFSLSLARTCGNYTTPGKTAFPVCKRQLYKSTTAQISKITNNNQKKKAAPEVLLSLFYNHLTPLPSPQLFLRHLPLPLQPSLQIAYSLQ